MALLAHAALFEGAQDRLKRAQKELHLAEENMAQVRERIRSSGDYEPDSLLFLCDDEDDHVLSAITKYLEIQDVARCEMACRTLIRQAKQCWAKFDEDLLADNPTLRSPSARDARERVVRYHLASSLARHIGSLGDTISRHLIVKDYDPYDDEVTDKRVPDCCNRKGECGFPDKLNFRVLRKDTTDEYELFVRFSRTNDNYLFAEGFLPFIRSDDTNLKIPLEGMNLSRWPKIVEITRLVETNGQAFADNDDLLHECMGELTAVVVAVDKTSFEASLVVAQCDFSVRSRVDDGGIDNMGDHGFCWPRGCLSSRSHGALETLPTMFDNTIHTNRDSDVKLGMLFGTETWTDPKENDRILAVECQWTLDCSYDLREDS